MTAGRTAIYVANTGVYLWKTRLPLLQRMRADGWRVIAVAPGGRYLARLRAAGIECRMLPVAREIARPLRHLRMAASLIALYREARPALVHHFTANPVIYGSLAARAAAVPVVVNALPGIGSVFASARWDAPLLRAWLRAAYRVVTRLPNSRTVFQNAEDRDAFVGGGVVPASRAVLIRSSGIDVDAFLPRPEPEGVPTVLFCGRMLRSKGLEELMAAARLLRAWGIDCRVRLVGPCDPPHLDSVPPERLRGWEAEGLATWDGVRDDMPEVFAAAHVVCLPSYREGVPRVLVEGAACGRALVASDIGGCREIVVPERNGLLVPPRQAEPLARALARLLRDASERRAFGRAGRVIAVERFSVDHVITATLELYRAMGVPTAADRSTAPAFEPA